MIRHSRKTSIMAVMNDKNNMSLLISQSRSLPNESFTVYCKHAMTCIASGKRGQECCQALRDLYPYISCQKKRRIISDELIKQLKNMVTETGKCPKKLRLLAMLILRELSPTIAYTIKLANMSADVNWLPLVFPLIFAQGEELGYIAAHVPQFVRWIKSSPGFNSQLQMKSLLCLKQVLSYYGVEPLTEDQVSDISSHMVQWLGGARTLSAPNPYQRKLFTSSKQKLQPVTELNGSTCNSFFTVLNIAQYCFPDQFLNIQTFSILRQWLTHTWIHQGGLGQLSLDISSSTNKPSLDDFDASPIRSFSSISEHSPRDDRVLHTPGSITLYEEISTEKAATSSPLLGDDSPSFSDITQAFSNSRPSTPVMDHSTQDPEDEDAASSQGGASNLSSMRQDVFGSESSFFSDGAAMNDGNLARKTLSYCYRVLRQCEYKPIVSQDTMLQKACIIEAVTLLDFFCSQEKSLVPKAIHAVRRIYNVSKVRLPAWKDVLLPMLLFFVNHGEALMLVSEPYCKFYFREVLINGFSSPDFAFETVSFCRKNLKKLKESTTIFSQFFPNILKILAWFPRTFLREFLELLPAMISEKTYVEIFHFLLDLPCLSAALETAKTARRIFAGTTEIGEIPPWLKKSVQAFQNTNYKPIFSFLLRQEAGMADTIDKLDVLHSLFQDCVDNPRVMVCSQAAWLMLRVYFQTVLKDETHDMAGKLFPIILERVTVIPNIESYKKNVQSLLAEELLLIFKQQPSLVVEYSSEIIEFVRSLTSLEIGYEEFFTNLIWVIGEYVCSKYDERCGNQLIIKFHEAVESATYELALPMNAKTEQESCSARLVSVLMTALAKLASRCQDLIPKVILCISKISKLKAEFCIDFEEKEAILSRASELISLLRIPNIAQLALSPDPSLKTGRLHSDRHTSHSFFLRTTKDMMFAQ